MAQLSKCEITLCIGNTHVLKLLLLIDYSEFLNSPSARFFSAHELCAEAVLSQGLGKTNRDSLA